MVDLFMYLCLYSEGDRKDPRSQLSNLEQRPHLFGTLRTLAGNMQ